jgi:D-3-phosphoglycerate dehydrogenase
MATKTVLLATEKPFTAAAVNAIEATFKEANYTLQKLEKYTDKSELLAAVKSVDAMIIRSDLATKEVIDATEKLKIIVRAGAGVDNIELKACTDKGVCAMNTPGQNSNAVAELAFGMMVMAARNNYNGESGYELKGKKLGLYGFGAVGRCMYRLAKGFEMDVVAYDPFIPAEKIKEAGAIPAEKVPELFKQCNFVSLHIPATPETKMSINEELLMSMPKKGVLVNTARKEVIHEEGMKAAFAQREDLRYICDVGTDMDPTEMCGAGRAYCTKKKMGAQTAEANENAGIAAAKQIVDFFEKGDVRFQVNKPGQKF